MHFFSLAILVFLARLSQLPNQEPEPNLDLIEPGTNANPPIRRGISNGSPTRQKPQLSPLSCASVFDGCSAVHIPLGRLDVGFVDIAPSPVFTRLEGLHDRMTSRVEVSSGVFVLRGVAATNISAGKAEAQMHPCVPAH